MTNLTPVNDRCDAHLPLMILEALHLSESGRAVLQDGEIERLMVNNVDIKFYPLGGVASQPRDKYQQGRLVLTSHRLLWIDYRAEALPGLSCWLPLSAVEDWEAQKSMSTKLGLKQEKIKFQIFENFDEKPAEGGIDAVRKGTIAIAFDNGLPSTFETNLQEALATALWNLTPSQPPPSASITPDDHQLPEGINSAFLQQLVEMGFDKERAIHALMATENRSVPDAMDYAIAFQDQSLSTHFARESQATGINIKSGIGHIMKKEEARLKQTNATLDSAFQDLQGLISKAQEMVKLAEKFRSSLSNNSSTDDELLDQETITEMISMGIASPVTKETAGALFHEELSRQLADFLTLPLEKVGGLMTLPDVYCLFNRGRGMELISPDDLIQAANLFGKMRLPLKIRSFPSGVTVIQSSSHDDEEICQRIAKLVKPENNGGDSDGQKNESNGLGRPLIASDLVHAFNISLNIAQEHLLLAEQREILCRDDSSQGVRFFYNFFK